MKVNGIEVNGERFEVNSHEPKTACGPAYPAPICDNPALLTHKIFNHHDETDYLNGHVVCCAKKCRRTYKIVAMELVKASDAAFSACRIWRYWLSRSWRPFGLLPENPLVCVGLNPSTADEKQDDPTIRRVIQFAKDWGNDGILMLNIFAYRATNPKVLRTLADDPVGPDNDDAIRTNARGRTVLCAWGKHGWYQDRGRRVLEILGEVKANAVCLGTNGDGSPKHPLYLKKTLTPVPYTLPPRDPWPWS